ncbi:acyl-coenzyme A thioesterase THEM4-like [Glandiceps talaboti]
MAKREHASKESGQLLQEVVGELGKVALPNERWLPESIELFNKLNTLTESKDWQKFTPGDETVLRSRSFIRRMSDPRPGQVFEYAFFYNSREGKLKGVCQFGPLAEGPPGRAHGGAVATIIDVAAGILANHSRGLLSSFTAKMDINYKSATPLGKALLIEAEFTKEIGRKSWIKCNMKSSDGETLHVESDFLFIQLKNSL